MSGKGKVAKRKADDQGDDTKRAKAATNGRTVVVEAGNCHSTTRAAKKLAKLLNAAAPDVALSITIDKAIMRL